MNRETLKLLQKTLVGRLMQWPSPEEIVRLNDDLRDIAQLLADGEER